MKIIEKKKKNISDFNDVVCVTGPKYLLIAFERLLKDNGITDDVPWNSSRRWYSDHRYIHVYLNTKKYCYYYAGLSYGQTEDVKDFLQ